MEATAFTILLVLFTGGYFASAQYKFQGQFDKFCNFTDVKKTKLCLALKRNTEICQVSYYIQQRCLMKCATKQRSIISTFQYFWRTSSRDF
uniref:Putative secreted protein n=1 Tax=Amblyomma parvum TaxID=251391 RepID=A0A023FZ09_AMBPA